MVDLSIIITIYNAERIIPELNSRVFSALEGITSNFEIVYVEDSSRDNSWATLKALAQLDKRIRPIKFARNFGQHTGISAGLQHCRGQMVIMMDGDLQDAPEAIPLLIQAKKSTDKKIVYVRRIERKHSFKKIMLSKIFYGVFDSLSGMKSDPSIGTFRIMDKIVVDSFKLFSEGNKYIGGIFYWMNFGYETLDIAHHERRSGKSGYNVFRLLKLASKGIVGFSNKPLRFSIYLGVFSAVFAFMLGILFLARKFIYDIQLPGYSSIIISIYFTGGILMIILGIIGEYIGRIFDQVKARPEYIIEEKLNF